MWSYKSYRYLFIHSLGVNSGHLPLRQIKSAWGMPTVPIPKRNNGSLPSCRHSRWSPLLPSRDPSDTVSAAPGAVLGTPPLFPFSSWWQPQEVGQDHWWPIWVFSKSRMRCSFLLADPYLGKQSRVWMGVSTFAFGTAPPCKPQPVIYIQHDNIWGPLGRLSG